MGQNPVPPVSISIPTKKTNLGGALIPKWYHWFCTMATLYRVNHGIPACIRKLHPGSVTSSAQACVHACSL